MDLKVVQPFGVYAVGDQITDQTEVAKILASEQSIYVVKVQSASAPVPQQPAAQVQAAPASAPAGDAPKQ